MKVWLGDGLVDVGQARVSALDRGLTVGTGVFETLKVVDGRPFALARHLTRLAASAGAVGIEIPPVEQVRTAVAAVIADAGPALGQMARLRITVTPGPGVLADPYSGPGPITLLVTITPVSPWPAVTDAMLVKWTRNPDSPLAGVKSTSYAENSVALAQARSRGYSEALLGNTRGELCEGTGSNVFAVLDGRLVTPPLTSGCLAGITRALVLEWTDAVEECVRLTELAHATEVFLTSSTRDVHPVARLGDRHFDAPGPVTRAAMACWQSQTRMMDG